MLYFESCKLPRYTSGAVNSSMTTVRTEEPRLTFKVRAARRGDAEAISALLKELGYPAGADAQIVNWVLSHPEMEVFVAGDSLDRPIGMASFSHRPQLRMKGRIATIDELVVAPAWRRKGVGAALVKRVIERARVLSVKRLELVSHVGRDQTPSDFFKAAGLTDAEVAVFRLKEIDFQR